MKTKELINILNQYDPEGIKEVLISNNDIDYILKEPMYESGKGYVVTKRYKQDQPLEITLSISADKINLIPIDVFDYYRKKIIEEQEFIEVKTENNYFYWESAKLTYNKLISLLYCKEYISDSDEKLYPYKIDLLEKINEEIKKLIQIYNNNYLDYCEELNFSLDAKNNLLRIVDNLFKMKNNIILSIPMLNEKSITIKSIGMKLFKFEIFENLIKFTQKDNYISDLFHTTNIDLERFNFKKTIGSTWENLLNNKIEKMLIG